MKTNTFNSKTFFLISTILVFLPLLAFCQVNKLIQDVSLESLNLSVSEMNALNRLQSYPTTKNIYPIEVGSIADIIKSFNRSVPIKLPGNNGAIIADTRRFEFESNDNYRWVADFTNKSGSIYLVCKNGKYGGTIKVGTKTYELRTLGSSINILLELNNLGESEENDVTVSKFSSVPLTPP